MTTLIATSVVRGSQQGDSHGGVYLVDLATQQARQMLDWNTVDIDWRGRGWDRGLRGIACAGERIFIAASDELYAYTPDFRPIGSWRNPYLKHCHEICLWQDQLFLTSTGFDSILGFNLNTETFDWALAVDTDGLRYRAATFDPKGDQGPLMLNKLHLNSIHCNGDGMYFSGLNTDGMLHFNGRGVNMSATLPGGTHNARPFQDGVLFNDTRADVLRFASRDQDRDRAFGVPQYGETELTGVGLDESRIARAGFARGLCVISDSLVAGGSSPSSIAVHDLKSGETALSVRLSSDVRNAIHGLEVWPY
ncbi:hypothetical protein [Microbulbifer salipaludis]|uniref:hypothetical protein n=1 Tax=Microbulbifer salipaludis TaxID=187980 RepID=UPI0030F46556